ncbi:hypothetical protein OAR36_12920 [Pseudomonadales bacterium]|nr:hypothetical protein [Pseudomonadales bacterium]
MMTLIKYALHPVILLCVIGAWLMNPESPALYLVVLLCVQLLLGTLEYWIPARPMWVVHAKEKITGILIVLVLIICSISVAMLYVAFLSEPLALCPANGSVMSGDYLVGASKVFLFCR